MILLGIRRLRALVATLPVHRRHHLVHLRIREQRLAQSIEDSPREQPTRTTYPGYQASPPHSSRSPPPWLGPHVAAFQALVKVAHHRGHQHVDLAVEEVVGGRNDARIDHDALLRLELLDQADDVFMWHDGVLVAMNDETRGRAGG